MAKDKLFNLVHSLSRGEKKHFHQYARRHVLKAKTKYLRLFDILDHQQEYDEKSIKKHFTDSYFKKNFHKIKRYLYELVLKSLTIQQAGKSSYSQVLENLSAVEILCEKLLFADALEQLQQAKKTAEAYEFQELALATIRWEEIIIATTQLIKDTSVHLADNYEKRKRLLYEITQTVEYRHHYFQISRLNPPDSVPPTDVLNELLPLLHHALLDKENEPEQRSVKRLYYSLHAMRERFMGNKINAVNLMQKLTGIMESYPLQFYYNEFLLIYAYFIFINDCIMAGNHEVASEYLAKLRIIYPSSPQNRYFHFHFLFANELSYEIMLSNKKACMTLIDQFERSLKDYRRYSNQVIEFSNYQLAMNYLVSVKEYPHALPFINRVLNEKKVEEGSSYCCNNARLLNLIVHYELRHFSLLEHLIHQTEYYFATRNSNFRFRKEVLKFFKKALKPQSIMNGEFDSLANKLIELSNDHAEKTAMRSFIDCGWLKNHGADIHIS